MVLSSVPVVCREVGVASVVQRERHSVLRILVFHIQFLFLIPDSRAVYDLIFTLFILLITR